MICPRCNEEISDDVVYCTECGIRVKPQKDISVPKPQTSGCRFISLICLIDNAFKFALVSWVIIGFGGPGFIPVMLLIIDLLALLTGMLLWRQKHANPKLLMIHYISCIIVSIPILLFGIQGLFCVLGDVAAFVLLVLPNLCNSLFLLITSIKYIRKDTTI